MSETPTHHDLSQYVLDLRNQVGLRDWYLTIPEDDHCDDDADGDCTVSYGQKHARIRFRASWRDYTPRRLRSVAVHELIHCHVESMRWAVNNAAGPLGQTAFDMLCGAHLDAMEVAVDGISMAWSEFLPLPPWAPAEVECPDCGGSGIVTGEVRKNINCMRCLGYGSIEAEDAKEAA